MEEPEKYPWLAIAYHEAGHAVSALVLDLPFDNVTIKPSGDKAGCVVYDNPIYGMDPDNLSPEAILKIEMALVITLAGRQAEFLVTRDRTRVDQGALGDVWCAKDLAEILAKQSSLSSDMKHHFRQGYARADDVVVICETMINAVAVALLESAQDGRWTLTREQALAAIHGQSLTEAHEEIRLIWIG